MTEVRKPFPKARSSCVWRAEEICDQVRHKPLDVAGAAVASHLRNFWDPRMRADLIAYVDSAPPDLDPIVERAVALLRADG
jgi:formate dehydrogenase subunit delta